MICRILRSMIYVVLKYDIYDNYSYQFRSIFGEYIHSHTYTPIYKFIHPIGYIT